MFLRMFWEFNWTNEPYNSCDRRHKNYFLYLCISWFFITSLPVFIDPHPPYNVHLRKCFRMLLNTNTLLSDALLIYFVLKHIRLEGSFIKKLCNRTVFLSFGKGGRFFRKCHQNSGARHQRKIKKNKKYRPEAIII